MRTIYRGKSPIKLTDKDYLAAGGEASIYVQSGVAYKLYHDLKKILPAGKVKELAQLTSGNVVKPLDTLYDGQGEIIGYCMNYLHNTHPLCKLFTKAFKQANNIDHNQIVELIKAMQQTIAEVHRDHTLIVDLNELNILVADNFVDPHFIDVDSWQTPSYKATAIMDSIRDRKAVNGFTDLSDWFSFAILAFQLYINIHPYKGTHPKYKPSELNKRMDDNVTVFDSQVRLPSVCNDFKTIPPRHLAWFKAVLVKGDRSIPPLPDSSMPITPGHQMVMIQGSAKFKVDDVAQLPDAIMRVASYNGIFYYLTRTHMYVHTSQIFNHKCTKCCLAFANEGSPILVNYSNLMRVSYVDTHFIEIGTGRSSKGVFVRNNNVYGIVNGKLVETSFTKVGSRVVSLENHLNNVLETSAQLFDGCVIQDLLGTKWALIPYAPKACKEMQMDELQGHRVLDAKCERHVLVVLTEKGGKYHRFIFSFDKTFSSYKTRVVNDVPFDAINFTVLENGICALLSPDGEALELFTGDKITTVQKPPLDSTMPMFCFGGAVHFINGNTFHKLKMV